ncbi:46 kDa FK506-binding nuclear protein isoform X2 [Macrosteles quadrilineatus]|uniref:46 kDa FK506-binding nuclear protein isoform X2 n=1 Tax=Macrosteles quadrilineatus TaxID=74068 RepID=UPI0023E26569|nr:46 kDa FK506-binding nuclear protein isoform X2 [Macrosteles quadrilineatus]
MFWGLVLEPGKRYSTTVEKGFHVSKAALDCSSIRNESEILSVMLETEGSENLLCNLCKGKGILQESLDLNFMSGDRLTFECRGHGRIHLTGYLLPEEDDISGMLGDEEESEEEEEETEWSTSPEKPKKEKRKSDAPPGIPAKKKKTLALDDDTKESDSDGDELSDLSDDDDEKMEDEEDDDEGEEDDDETDEEDESEEERENLNVSHKKKQKEDKNKTPSKQNVATPKKTPVTNGVTPKDQKSNKKTPGGDKTPNSISPKHKQVLDQGVVVKEIKVGTGQPAKFGRTVAVHYIGKLKDSNKVFDKQTKGEGFKFKLGKGEVIKGWDIGLQNMKVGGKRVIHCPPEVAYGAKGAPPKIPPNSTLIFEVELKNVH